MGNRLGVKQMLFGCILADVKSFICGIKWRMYSIGNISTEPCHGLCNNVIDTIEMQMFKYSYDIGMYEECIDNFFRLLNEHNNSNELSYRIVEIIVDVEIQLKEMLRVLYIDCEDWRVQFQNLYQQIMKDKNKLDSLLNEAFMRQLYND